MHETLICTSKQKKVRGTDPAVLIRHIYVLHMQNKGAIYLKGHTSDILPKYWHNVEKKNPSNELKWTGNSRQRKYHTWNDVCWILFCTTDT